MKTVAAILTLALSISGCAGAIDATQYGESDSGTTDAGTTETTDAGEGATIEPEQPVYRLGDPCWCCVWDPSGTGYPNGEVYCMPGVVDILEGLMCRAKATDGAPSWAPRSKGCLLDNPWGAP